MPCACQYACDRDMGAVSVILAILRTSKISSFQSFSRLLPRMDSARHHASQALPCSLLSNIIKHFAWCIESWQACGIQPAYLPGPHMHPASEAALLWDTHYIVALFRFAPMQGPWVKCRLPHGACDLRLCP